MILLKKLFRMSPFIIKMSFCAKANNKAVQMGNVLCNTKKRLNKFKGTVLSYYVSSLSSCIVFPEMY